MTGAPEYRIGVDIGGTFTDVVLLGGRRHAAHAQGALDARRLRPGRRRRHARAARDGRRRARRASPGSSTRRPSPRTRCSRARARATALITTAGLPRRARDAPAPDPGHVRPPVREAAAARAAPAALRGRRADRRRGGEVVARARRERGAAAAARGRARRASRRSRSALLHSYANPDHERRAAEIVREVVGDGVYVTLLRRHPARDPRVRAHEHGGRQRVRRARASSATSARSTASSPTAGITAPLQIMQSGGGMMSAAAGARAPGLPRRVGAGRRRHRLRPPRAARPAART